MVVVVKAVVVNAVVVVVVVGVVVVVVGIVVVGAGVVVKVVLEVAENNSCYHKIYGINQLF